MEYIWSHTHIFTQTTQAHLRMCFGERENSLAFCTTILCFPPVLHLAKEMTDGIFNELRFAT